MCRKVVVNRGEKEIETPREFLAHFGFLPENGDIEIELDLCLCGFDIEAILNERGIPFKDIHDDLFVGDGLDLLTSPA